MRALNFILMVWLLSLCSNQQCFGNITFSHRNSTINVGSGKLIVNAPIPNWSGTLQQTGAVTGQPIGFNLGVLETSGTPALFTGTYDATSPHIVLTQNQSIRIDSGQFIKNIVSLRSGNRLEGQPVFTQGSAIRLSNPLSDLTLALNAPINTSIVMNGGKLILDGDVNLSDDNVVTGSGTVNVNGKRFMFGGPLTSSSLKLTHTLLWNNASAVELNGPVSLSGAWTFQSLISGNQPCILGHGNILDLTQRGSIFVPRNTTLYLVDLKIKGLGRGGFVLQDKTSQIRCSGVEFEMANSYTFTTGGMFFDKTSTIVTKAGLLTFSLLSSLTVDGVTLFYDSVNTPDIFNIRPLIASPANHGNVTYVNSGIIRGVGSGDGALAKANSNALLMLDRTDSAAKLFLTRNNSNTLLFLNRTNSRADARGIRNNSNTLLFLDRADSNAKLFFFRNNSNAIIALSRTVRTNSNADARGIRNNSNALLMLDRTDSAAKLFFFRNNSNTLLFLNRNNSNTLLFLERTDSATKLFLTKNLSNTIINILNPNNTNSLASQIRHLSNTILFLDRTDSAAKLFLTRNNSNTLLFLNRTNSRADARGIRNNSNALLMLDRTDSAAKLFFFRNNSNTLLFLNRNNSNTLLFLERTDSATKLFLTKNLSNTIINILNPNNTNSLTSQIRQLSNTILFLDRTDSAAKLFLTRNNSNTLLFLNKNNSNTLLFLDRTDSAAKLYLAENNSNSLLFLTRNNSNTLLFLNRNNSNALLACCRDNSNTLLFLTRNLSNALLFCCANTHLVPVNPAFGCQDISGKLDLTECLCLGPTDCMNIVGDACIDGHGVEVEFTNQPFSQFTVQPGVTVTLKNVTFTDINQKTFALRDNSAIQIGENVIWELDTDVTFSANALIKVLDGTNDCTPITGVCNIFTIRGETCRRAFKIQPLNDSLPNGQPRRTFDLGHNTVLLESAQLSGFDFMTFFNDDICAAAVALACDAGADIYSNFPGIGGKFSTAMNFFVEGLNNDIILRQDGFVLAGNITFGDFPDNELHIRFNFAELLASSNPARTGVLPEFPVVELAGNPGIFLFSEGGVAELFFDDLNAAVRDSNDNAFVVDDNGVLVYKRLQILDNPIKQQSARFRLEGLELLDQRIDPGFIRSPRLMSRHILITAIHIRRQQEREIFEQAQKQAQADAKKTNQTHNRPVAGKVNKKRPLPKYRGIDFEWPLDEVNTDEVRSIADEMLVMRLLSLPASFDQSYVDQVLNPATPISGNIHYTRTTINNFIVDPGLAFNILIEDGSAITLGADVVLNASHKINVKGLGNVINIPFGMTIGQDNIFLDEGAELTFQFATGVIPTPTLIITDNTVLDIEPDTIVRLKGPGVTTLGNGVLFNFKGVKTVHPVTKAETVSSRGSLIITEDATLSLASGAVSRMKGVGELEVTKRGTLLLDKPSSLIFGSDEPTVMVIIQNVDPIFPSENFQDMILNVFDDGQVILKPGVTVGGQRARISFHYLTSVIKFENSGFLFVDDNGTFEINADNGTPFPSRLNELSFRAGILNVRGSGRFAMGSNKLNLGTGQPYPFSYDGVASQLEGTGKAQFIDPILGFEGFIMPTPAARDEINPQTAFNLIRSLIGLS